MFINIVIPQPCLDVQDASVISTSACVEQPLTAQRRHADDVRRTFRVLGEKKRVIDAFPHMHQYAGLFAAGRTAIFTPRGQ